MPELTTKDALIERMVNALQTIKTNTDTNHFVKYGITLNDLIGDVTNIGYMPPPATGQTNLVVTDVLGCSGYAFAYKFYRNSALVSVTFADMESAAGFQSFYNAFSYCTNLEEINFPKLKTIGSNNSNVNNNHFGAAFTGCTKLKTITFPELTTIYCNGTANLQGTFNSNAYIEKLYFPKLKTITVGSGYTNTTAVTNILKGCTALAEVHFAAANKTAIEGSDGYSTEWGSTATISFDL